MDSNAVEVVLRANTSNLIAGMKEAASATGNAGAAMREEFGSIGEAAGGSRAPLVNLTDAMKEWRTHVRTEARYTQFMAQQVAGLGIASKGAAAEITGFVSAFAFGGGIGLAVEGVKLIAHVFGDIQEAEKKAKEEFDKYVDDLVAGTEKIKKQAELQLMALGGASKAQIQAAQDIKPLLAEREDLEKKVAAAELEVVKLRQGEGVLVAELGPKQAEIEQKELDRMREKIRLLTEQINARQVAEGSVRTAELPKEIAKDEDEEAKEDAKKEKLRVDHLTRVHAAEAAAQVALDKMVTEHTAQRVQIDKNFEAIEDANKAEHDKEVKDRFEELKKQLKQSEAEGQKFGTAFGGIFAGIATGTMSATKAFADMSKAALHVIFDMVRKSIEAYALQAAAAAAAANAGIPGIGVFVAMAAAAAMEAAVDGLLSALPSAAGGWAVPHDTIAMVHAGEHILPAPIAQKYEQGAGGGVQGGGDMHVHLYGVTDADSFRRFWNNPNNVREFEDAVRRGRLRT